MRIIDLNFQDNKLISFASRHIWNSSSNSTKNSLVFCEMCLVEFIFFTKMSLRLFFWPIQVIWMLHLLHEQQFYQDVTGLPVFCMLCWLLLEWTQVQFPTFANILSSSQSWYTACWSVLGCRGVVSLQLGKNKFKVFGLSLYQLLCNYLLRLDNFSPCLKLSTLNTRYERNCMTNNLPYTSYYKPWLV